MPASVRSRLRWRSPASSRSSFSVPRGSPPWSSTSAVSTLPVRWHGWRRGATVQGWPPRTRSPRPAHRWNCAATAATSSPGSLADLRCCPASSSPLKRFRRQSLADDERGAATVLAALMVAALVTVTVGGLLIGSAVVARHRAQSAADLAALAAAARVPAGAVTACAEALAVATSVHADVRSCEIEQLNVVVTVAVGVSGPIGTEASAAARAGPAG